MKNTVLVCWVSRLLMTHVLHNVKNWRAAVRSLSSEVVNVCGKRDGWMLLDADADGACVAGEEARCFPEAFAWDD
eukprot:4027697-Amphidinium_carterae.2